MTMKSTLGRVTEPAGSDAQARCSAADTDQETRHVSTIKPPPMMGVDARMIGSILGVKAHSLGTARATTVQATTIPAIECSHSTVQRMLRASQAIAMVQTSLWAHRGYLLPSHAKARPATPKRSTSAVGIIQTKWRFVRRLSSEIRSKSER